LWETVTTERQVHEWIVQELTNPDHVHRFAEDWVKMQLLESERFLRGPVEVEWAANLFDAPLDRVLLVETKQESAKG
jgi:hypothetical protein